MFSFRESLEFWINEASDRPVYERHEEVLFVIMSHKTMAELKVLLIFRLNTIAHNSLVSIIQLNDLYYARDNYIFTERTAGVSTIFIYIFYGGDVYQFIQFEPDNMLRNNRENANDLFLPDIKMTSFPDQLVTLSINPINPRNSRNSSDTESQEKQIDVLCTNNGLRIEKRRENSQVVLSQNDETLRMPLLDHFTGFDIRFDVQYFGQGEDKTPFEYSIYPIEAFSSDIIDSITQSIKVTNALLLSDRLLLLFFNAEQLMQVYKVEPNSIERTPHEYDYSDLFND